MTVKILFFGATADAVGKRRVEVALDAETPAGSVFDQVLKEFPQLKDRKLLFSVNQEYTGADRLVRDGDELAIFTAVSGG